MLPMVLLLSGKLWRVVCQQAFEIHIEQLMYVDVVHDEEAKTRKTLHILLLKG